MASILFKLISTITAFCPALLVYGVKRLFDSSFERGYVCIVLGFVGFFIHYILVKKIKSTLPDVELTITELTPADSKIIAYIVGYFIPILEGTILSGWHLLIVGTLLFIVIAISNATVYNPLYFLLFGYHYFDIKDGQTINKTIISKSNITAINKKLTVKELGSYQYLKF